jgi:hypothetical protein
MQLNIYPELTLRDLYKSFFQDRFGPGHIISDTLSAKLYLDEELSEFESSHNPDVEPTGWENNYVRVNLSLLKRELIPKQAFLEAFIESANSAEHPKIKIWKSEWTRILRLIEEMQLDLPDFARDKTFIDSLLMADKYAIHHSRRFNEAYRPHYRIIDRTIFEDRLRKYLR